MELTQPLHQTLYQPRGDDCRKDALDTVTLIIINFKNVFLQNKLLQDRDAWLKQMTSLERRGGDLFCWGRYERHCAEVREGYQRGGGCQGQIGMDRGCWSQAAAAIQLNGATTNLQCASRLKIELKGGKAFFLTGRWRRQRCVPFLENFFIIKKRGAETRRSFW